MEVVTQVDARKTRLGAAEALRLLDGIDELWVTKGKQVVQVNLETDRPDRKALLALLLGPSGNLRAPTVRVGRRLLVGFDEAMYRKQLAAR
jgi:arsenate reductase-like glutaredoxin family protein